MPQDPMKYTAADIKRMKEQVKNLKSLLAEETDAKRKKEITNQIRGLENSISGKFN